MKVLIVEDKKDVRVLLQKQIRSREYETTECHTAAAALEAFQKATYAMVVMDLELPDLDGLELCRRIRAVPQGKQCMVLILTDRDAPQDLLAAFEAGADEYLIKPVNEELLTIRLMTMKRELKKLFERNQALKAFQKSLNLIERAKQEWEATADSMSSVVCLLNSWACVVRANRAIEYWKLGNVLTVKGQKVHDLFHPDCSDPDCCLKVFLRQAWVAISQGKAVEREVEDPVLQRQLHLQIRPVAQYKGKKLNKNDSFAAFVVNDITERKQTGNALYHQKTLLHGIAEATNKLLVEPDFHVGINKALETLGVATQVDRVYLFKTHPHPETKEPAMSQLFEWTRDPNKARLENPELQNLPYNSGFTRWYTMLSNNTPIYGLVRDFPPSEQNLLKLHHSLSTLVMPIIISERLWGCIGFDDCQRERQWQEEEKASLLAAASSIGGALAHKQTEEQLHRTSSELRAVFQSLPDEYFRLNVDGSILDYKTDHGSQSSLSKTFILKWAAGILPKEIEHQFDVAVAQVLKTREPATVNYWMPLSDEKQRYEEVRVFPFLKDQVLITVRDITDWKLNTTL